MIKNIFFSTSLFFNYRIILRRKESEMGPKSSRQQQQQNQQVFSNNENQYPSNVRAYAKWEHRVALTSNDVSRAVSQEIQNLQRHNQIIPPSTSHIYNPQEKSVKVSSSNNNLAPKKPLYDQNIQKPKLGIRKSQSVENLSDTTSVITVQQLLYDQSKRRRRNKSPSSQISTQSSMSSYIQKSTSSTSLNQVSTSKNKRKKIPDDFTFVSINPNELQVNYLNFIQKFNLSRG